MRHEELDRLLWELCEGTISAADRRRVEAHLADNPEAVEERDRIQSVASMLGSVERIAPPPSLEEGIRKALAGQPLPHRRGAAWRTLVQEVLAPRWRARVAWATVGICLGVAIAVLVLADFRRAGDSDVSRFWGAMRAHGLQTPPGIELALPDSLGRLGLSREDGRLRVELQVFRTSEGDLTLELLGDGLSVASFAAAGGAPSKLMVIPQGIILRAMGTGELVVTLVWPASPLRIRAVTGGRVLVERVVGPGDLPRG